MLAAIKWEALLELLWVAPVAGFALSLSFSIVILGISRAEQARAGESIVWGVVALAGLAAVAAGVVFALNVIVG